MIRSTARRLVLTSLLLATLLVPALTSAPSLAASAADSTPDPAARKAAVRSVLKQSQDGTVNGRLISRRAACVAGRVVYSIVADPGRPFPDVRILAVTDETGRWSVGGQAGRGEPTTTSVAVITLGGPRCDVAQSNRIDAVPVRRGADRPDRVRPADVSITLQGSRPATLGGRITSRRAACERSRPVYLFVRPADSPGEPTEPEVGSVSRRSGVWRLGDLGPDVGTARGGGSQFDVTAVVLGTGRCQPAQSPRARVRGPSR